MGKRFFISISIILTIFLVSFFTYVSIQENREKKNANFTIIVLPDTQAYSSDYPNIFDNQTLWINSAKQEQNIVFVTHEGDIVNDQSSIDQWQNANHSMSILDGKVRYSISPGNYDMQPSYGGGNTANYNSYFPVSRFSSELWGRNFDGNDNNYHLFSAGGQDFIIFQIEFDANGAQATSGNRHPVYAWINNVLETHWNRKAIITTHDYLDVAGQRTEFGADLWNHVINTHSNVFLVLCGHKPGEANRTDNNIDGKPVYQLLADYQDYPNGGDGFLRILKFVPAEMKIYVKTYSPYLAQTGCTGANQVWRSDGCYENDTNSEFVLDYPAAN